MDRSRVTFRIACLLIVTLLCLAPGCDNDNWWYGLPVGFVAGTVVGYLLPHPPTVVRECYVNGVQVDCSELTIPVP